MRVVRCAWSPTAGPGSRRSRGGRAPVPCAPLAADEVSVPESLAASVRALGSTGARWLADLPELLAGLAADWSLTYGRPLDDGAAYVVEAVTADGRPAVLKVAPPAGADDFSPFEQESEALLL